MDPETETTRRDLVVMGGSAGSSEALRTILGALPANFPAAILIAMHAGPAASQHMATILGRYTSLPVAYAVDGEPIQPGHVYLAVPDRHLEVAAPGVLRLSDGPKIKHARPAADRLFETAAALYANRVISVILSGGDGDGTDGANTVIAAGGLNIVQDPKDALAPAMPMHAIKYDHPLSVLSAPDIALKLCKEVAARHRF